MRYVQPHTLGLSPCVVTELSGLYHERQNLICTQLLGTVSVID